MELYPNAYMMEEAMVVFFSALTSAIPSSVLGIAMYVLSSMALYTLATRRGISKAWLSWVPVLNVWIIGSLSDQYRYVVNGQYKSKRKTLLTLNLLNILITVVMVIVAIVMVVDVIRSAVYGASEEAVFQAALVPLFVELGLLLPMVGMAVAATVIRFMALYDIYKSMDPGNCVLYLVLSILFNVTEPFFLFFNRNKDDGMPPRRPEPQWIHQGANQNVY